MRIITGSHRGKKLITLEGEQVRPTTDRVKESLFNILQFQLEGRRFLDLFAGSGQIGLEALSRGAAQAVFVDASKESIRVVEKNLASTGLGDRAKVVTADFAAICAPAGTVLTWLFWTRLTAPACWSRLCLGSGGYESRRVILCEHPKEEVLPETAGGFVRHKSYRYGKIMLTAYRPPEETPGGEGAPGA